MKHFLTSTAAAALMTLASVAGATDLKMSHVRPQDATIDVELRAFSAAVADATGGDVNIEIFPASALGDYTTVQERVSVGAIDMATQPAATAADRRMQISSFPFLANSWDDARAIYGPDGPVRTVMAELYAERGPGIHSVADPLLGSLHRDPDRRGRRRDRLWCGRLLRLVPRCDKGLCARQYPFRGLVHDHLERLAGRA